MHELDTFFDFGGEFTGRRFARLFDELKQEFLVVSVLEDLIENHLPEMDGLQRP
jgi:hypothetical protein